MKNVVVLGAVQGTGSDGKPEWFIFGVNLAEGSFAKRTPQEPQIGTEALRTLLPLLVHQLDSLDEMKSLIGQLNGVVSQIETFRTKMGGFSLGNSLIASLSDVIDNVEQSGYPEIYGVPSDYQALLVVARMDNATRHTYQVKLSKMLSSFLDEREKNKLLSACPAGFSIKTENKKLKVAFQAIRVSQEVPVSSN